MGIRDKLSYFRGGIHPSGYKYLTKDKHIVELKAPEVVVIPLSQHTGKPAKPVVNKGDYVLKGQKIGEAEGKISAPVHSSLSGKVKDIYPWAHPVISSPVSAVVIESDGSDSSVEFKKIHSDYYRYSPDELRGVIRDAGIVGLGGAAFPTHVKLSPPDEIHVVIINGCECEPYLSCDDRLMQEHTKDIINGLKIIMYILDVSRGIVVIEDNKADAIKLIKNAVHNEPNIELKIVKTKYPQGAEKQLIKTVLNREVPSGKLPFDVRVVVQNVATSYAVSRAVMDGIPLISRAVTVTGSYIQRPGNYIVRVGTLLKDLLAECGYTANTGHKVIFGGPMMGIAEGSLDVPVIKGTSGVLVLPVENASAHFSPCIRCGRCIDVCPMNLMPNMMSIYAENQLWEKTDIYYPRDCIECGCCAYVCVAKRPLVQHIKLTKLNLKP
jgi:electron transport complex protein RnfC